MFQQLSEQGSLVHFSHANGYPPQTYNALLSGFVENHRVVASEHRPLWKPALEPSSLNSWQSFGDDVVQVLEQVTASDNAMPVTSIGHSMGASALVIAAAQRPDLFQSLVLIEPVLLPRRYRFLLRLFSRVSKEKIPLIRRTLERVDHWQDRNEAFTHYRPKRVFNKISDEVLWDYVTHGLQDNADGSVGLRYSKQWEAHCYTTVFDLWRLMSSLKMPVLALRGAESDTLSLESWRRWQKLSPQHKYIEVPNTGHLLPFEEPQQVIDTIHDWLAV